MLENLRKQGKRISTQYLNKRCVHVGGVLMTIKKNTYLPLSAMRS